MIFYVVDRYFNPVGKLWQIEKCGDGYEIVETPELYEDIFKVLRHPSRFKIIDKDGNCLFRALSYWVSGTQDMHVFIRAKVVDVML